MINYPALIFGLAGLAVVITGYPNNFPRDWSNSRIVGGEDVNIEEVPYQVSVQLRGRHWCGGSIISNNWVLTAAHCTQLPQRKYSIRAGSVWDDRDGNVYEVDKIINYHDYSDHYDVPAKDISLVHVRKPFVFDETCQIIELPDQGEKVKIGAYSVVTGWGVTKKFPISGRLQAVSVPIISIKSCRKAYEFADIPDHGVICAMAPEGGKDSCQGDSGGPMVVDRRLVGIVSWGVGCALPGNPGVYTEVQYYRDWIKSITGIIFYHWKLFLDMNQRAIVLQRENHKSYRFIISYKYAMKSSKQQTVSRPPKRMFKFVFSAALLAFGFANAIHWYPRINPFTPHGRIVGGKPTDVKEVPHQVSLQVYGFAFCGGTIVAEDWVLTAAHCAVYSASAIEVRAGTSTKGSGGTLHGVSKIIVHENFKTNRYGIPINDVALLKLSTPFDVDEFRQPIDLFEFREEAIEGIHSTITGWGATVEGGSTPEVLNTVDVPIISKKECHDAYISFGGLPEGQICAAYPEGGKDACQGDSGGPLTIQGRLAGIVSWGNGCARPGYPGVYTEVASFRDWIDDKMAM
ncbi:uncharacterized protein LOC103570336 [Microplitis demolitor]|uniref:uncharacterized protein LOC103570336 n=1 Tax=Microplitis demolitor TaxID=69319 RepID=UPI00235B5C1E|nr:uncharacterized protein LOC103570336 [Microplitis demolitor]